MYETLQIVALGILSAITLFIFGCLFGQWLLSRPRTGLELVDGQIAIINATGKREVIQRRRAKESRGHNPPLVEYVQRPLKASLAYPGWGHQPRTENENPIPPNCGSCVSQVPQKGTQDA